MDNYNSTELAYKNGITHCIKICEEFKNDISGRFESYGDSIVASNIDVVLCEIITKMKKEIK